MAKKSTGSFPDVKTVQMSGVSIQSVPHDPVHGRCEICHKAMTDFEFSIGCYQHHLCNQCFTQVVKEFAGYLKPQEGHWGFIKYDTAVCSLCGHTIFTDFETTAQAKDEWNALAEENRFCPHCGAKMVEGSCQ